MCKETVSVIIPTFKRNEKVRSALNSVLTQTYKNLEVIVVDDNAEIDRKFRDANKSLELDFERYRNVKFFYPDVNLGGAGARNFGIEVATGEYVAFLDDDDLFLPEKLQQMLNRFKNSSATETINYCYAKDTDGNLYQDFFEGGSLPICFERFAIAATSQLMIQRKALVSVNGFDNLPSKQDANLLAKLLIAGNQVICTPIVLNIYNVDPGEKISRSGKYRAGYLAMFEKFESVQSTMSNTEVRQVKFSLLARELREALKYKDYGHALYLVLRLSRVNLYRLLKFMHAGFKQSFLDSNY